MNEASVPVAAITIINDESPEADMEQFTLSLTKGEGSETLNFALRVTVATLSIIDDDGRFCEEYAPRQFSLSFKLFYTSAALPVPSPHQLYVLAFTS